MDGFNIHRKLFHLIGFAVPASLYFDICSGAFGLKYATRAVLFTVLGAVLVSMSLSEFIRLHNSAFNEFFQKYFGKLMKEAEKNRMNGTIPYILSNAIVVAFFPAQIIFLAMGCLLIGDPVAAYFGSKYGKYRFYNGKSLVGVVAFIIGSIIACTILMFLFQATYGDSLYSAMKAGQFSYLALFGIVIGAVFSGLAEFFSGHGLGGLLEDNLLIPIVASLVLAYYASFSGLSTSQELFFPIQDIFAKI